jgi:phosphate uptake regulator
MLRELLQIFRAENPLHEMADNFAEMLRLTQDMTATAGKVYFREPVSPDERGRIRQDDTKVNTLERLVRKQVVAHVSVQANKVDVPYCLLLMSLVKDVERIGDYAKNLSEVIDIYSGDLPDDDIVRELREMRSRVESTFQATAQVFQNSDREQALTLIQQGKYDARRADALLPRIAASDYNAGVTATLVLGARYYKRFGGHLLNVLSSVVMPLHKVDYYDEDEVRVEANDVRQGA